MTQKEGRIYMVQIRSMYPCIPEDGIIYVAETYGIGGEIDDNGNWHMSEIYFARLASEFQREAYDRLYRRDHVEVRDAALR